VKFGFENTLIQLSVLYCPVTTLIYGIYWSSQNETGAKMIELLDEYIPFVTGSEINDDPFNPISRFAKDTIAARGEATPIS
jgi:magnesium chelatase subunit I